MRSSLARSPRFALARSKEKVDELYKDRRFWPEPLLQINPHYKADKTVKELVSGGLLEPECERIFTRRGGARGGDQSLKLYMHQEQAISLS